MSEEIYTSVLDDIKSRTSWETRQGLWYQMRTDGLARKAKPWGRAADMHFPLIDTTINKLKPSFFQQSMGLDVLATFVPMRQQLSAFTATAEQWFSYKLHEKSNYSTEVMSWIDYMLTSGRGIIKIFWNPDKKQVEFQSVDPMHLIVPPWTKDLEGADRITQVIPMSMDAYKRAGIYATSEEVMKKLRGGKVEDTGISSEYLNKREIREGLTHSEDKDQIIVWEVYTQDDEGKWTVQTFSPQAPEVKLRDDMEVPFDHGKPPFVACEYEITDGGWYSPRGVCEMLAPFEAALCKLWNEKLDSATLFNQPMFRSERDLPNSINLRMKPGQILPFGIAPVTMPQPPLDFDKEIVRTQSIAEGRVTVPDYGITQVMNTRDRRTATEIESINAQSAQSMDLRLRLFRQALGKMFRQAYEILIQYDKKSLQFRFLEDSLNVDPVALHDDYQIEPRGGMDMVSRQMLLNKAVQRKMLLGQSPWIDQVELDKSILELEDPSLIARLVRDPQNKVQDEVEDEQRTIPALLLGQNVAVKQYENLQGRIQVLMGFIEQSRATGQPISPQGQQAVLARLGGLISALEVVDANTARALRKDVQKYLETTGIIANQEEAQMPQVPVDASIPQPEAAPEPPVQPQEAVA